jgi:DNA-binding SARP family transcriptional activator/TolB-like protein/Flp pilus assembly protein TadD
MFTLQMLGGITLTDETGAEVDALLRQSKHVALLAYLASPKPGTWHKRDSVIGTFWAENDQTRARSAFRSALYTLRGHLPENAIRSRGDNDLSVDPQLISTDTAAMTELLERGDFAEALACYKGEFLPGIYIPDAEGFEQWLELERRRTRNIASQAARRLSEELEGRNDLDGAIRAAKRNYELDPDDEGTARRLITLLDRSGDRAQAFAVYEEFRNHVYEAFGIRPSAETVALLDAIRTRHEPTHIPVATVTHTPAAPVSHETVAPRRRPAGLLALLAIPAIVAIVAWTVWPREKPASTASAARTLVVLPVANETGDPSLDYIATGIGEDLARRLDDVGGFEIRSAARSTWPDKIKNDLRGISRAYNANFLLRAALTKSGDSLRIATTVVDGASLSEEPLTARSFSQSSIIDVESRIAADIAGSVFREALPKTSSVVDPESYRLTLQGFHQLLSNIRVSRGQGPQLGRPAALDLFRKAIGVDPTNARAWAGLSSVLSSRIVTDAVPFDEGFEQASAAASKALALDSMQGTALANLGLLRALKFRKLSIGEPWIEKAEAVEPSNPEVYLVKSVLYRNAHMWEKALDAIRVARKLEPLSSLYSDREALVEFCADNPAKALELYLAATPLDPTDGVVQGGITRALAMLGRYDEAIASWRTDARLQSDTAVLKALVNAKGETGYWGARHSIGRVRLKNLARQPGRISLIQIMRANLAAGDSVKGFEALDQIVEQKLNPMYRLTCMSDADEYRHTPRFKAITAKAGALPP